MVNYWPAGLVRVVCREWANGRHRPETAVEDERLALIVETSERGDGRRDSIAMQRTSETVPRPIESGRRREGRAERVSLCGKTRKDSGRSDCRVVAHCVFTDD